MLTLTKEFNKVVNVDGFRDLIIKEKCSSCQKEYSEDELCLVDTGQAQNDKICVYCMDNADVDEDEE